MNILLTVEELAKYLKIKPDTIYKKVRKGELPAIKLGKLVRFPKELIDQWIVEQATKTMKEVKAATQAVEAKVEEAVSEVKKTAKAAGKVMHEVPEVIEDVKKAPLKRKQETLARGLKTLWDDFSDMTKAPKARAKKATGARKKARKLNGKGGAHRVAPAPKSVHTTAN